MKNKAIRFGLFLVFALGVQQGAPAFAEAPAMMIDDFEGSSNKVGGKSNTYVQEPSRALALRVKDNAHEGTGGLMIKYDKKAKGGPYDSGGWCGYYTLLKTGAKYFDATQHRNITFWVKGATGDENFVLGVSDKHWDEVGDSVKSEEIGNYLPGGKVTTEWQKATVPLSAFMVNLKELASIAICFEGSVLPGGAGTGTLYVDDLALE
jgi:hypothetical protein